MDLDDLPEDTEHNRLYKQALRLVYQHLPLHGMNHKPPGWLLRRRLRKGVRLLERVVAMNERNWAAMWMAGMTCRRLGDLKASLHWLARAHDVKPDQPDVSREAAITAMDLGRHDDAIRYTNAAIEFDPDDPGLVANLALAYLLNQQPEYAHRLATTALERDPSDAVTRKLVEVTAGVVAGKRPCPRGVHDK